MALIARLMGEDPEVYGKKLPVHQYVAAVAEVARGSATAAPLVAKFDLDATEQAQTQALINAVTGGTLTRVEVHDVLLMAEQRLPPYTSVAAVESRLGL